MKKNSRKDVQSTRTSTNPATNSVVISIFAIIILSTIGSMFASGHHIVMGSSEDPKDGKGVAAAVFGAVVVYGVRITSHKVQTRAGKPRKRTKKLTSAGLPRLLRQPGLPTPEAAGGR